MTHPEDIPDAVAAELYRQAQTNRLIRFCEEHGLAAEDVKAGQIDLDLSPICDERG